MSGDPISHPPCTCCRPTFTPIAPGPGVFDLMAVTGWRPTDPQPSTVVLSDADVERIARRVAELINLPDLGRRAPHITPGLLDASEETQ